jgi:ribosome maturation protein SDO1
MSAAVFTPVNQVRLTNVAVVRLKKGGKRFELACYKNKVISWRNKVETDLDEVLQTRTIFTNVSKGEVAKKVDLEKCFKTFEEQRIIEEILRKGVLQVSEKERQAALESSFKEIASLVSNQTVDPGSKKPYPVTVIENAMKQAHFSVKPQRPAKLQALEVIKLLKESMPIERAQIRIQINFPVQFKLVKDQLEALVVLTEHLEVNSEVEMASLQYTLVIFYLKHLDTIY